ncbi:TPR-like protein [Dioscorea alata]|uniref:TPR-like protein n=1 Tax=Dioscorea alata TaxID=55571 RepID=A0ACB7VRQ7_DIOAL|nr:TPR-like protein [Dioscorea alata]
MHLGNANTHVLLDLIARARCLRELKQAHAQALARGLLQHDLRSTSALILAYSAHLSPSSSRLLFHLSPLKPHSAFLYNTLLRSLSNAHLHSDALSIYNLMLRDGVRPDDRTFPFTLTACAAAANVCKGTELHGSIVKLGFFADVFVGNTLFSLYGVCGQLFEARQVFDEMPMRDIVSWNSAISVFSANGLFVDSLSSFSELVRSGLLVNSVSLVSVLPACSALHGLVVGEIVHGLAIKVGLYCLVSVGNALVDLYGKCGDTDGSMRAFGSMPERNDVSWNSLIGSLAHVGLFGNALRMFRKMLDLEMKPNSITMSSLLPALVELGLFRLGREVHGYSLRTSMESDVFVANSLVDMYAKYGSSRKASAIFHGMQNKNVVSWNAMIANLTQNGAELAAIKLVKEMQDSGECPNSITFTNVLPACARLSLLMQGREIHARAMRIGSNFDIFVSNALIDMYAKCGRLELAQNVFEVSEKDEVSYNTLILGYSQSAMCIQALFLFTEMGSAGFKYDAVSLMGALSACGNMSLLKQGKEIHCLSFRRLLHTHLFVANSLLDLYVKGGRLDFARKVFDRIPNRDVASWNSMILGYGMQGEIEAAVDVFDMMKDAMVEYDHVSYIAVLSACSHGGLIERGKRYFDQMLDQNIKPTQMHYACIVDLLGRAGQLEEAAEFIKQMPFEADSNVWGALLGACRMHGSLVLGRWAAEHLFQLKPGHSGYYTLLSNMYAEAARWDEANEIRKLMKTRRVRKNPGCSWVQSDNCMHAFLGGERMEELETDFCFEEQV